MNNYNTEEINEDILEKGKPIGAYDIPREIMEMVCRSLRDQGYAVDWGYCNGRAVPRTLNVDRKQNFKKVFGMFEMMSILYDNSQDAGFAIHPVVKE